MGLLRPPSTSAAATAAAPLPLHPDTAAELVLKSCQLLMAVLRGGEVRGRGGPRLLPPGGPREAVAAGAVHVLLACGELLRHISEQVWCPPWGLACVACVAHVASFGSCDLVGISTSPGWG